jgi:hypothetical protein
MDGNLSSKRHEHDVLVIGAGGAGLRAAIEASAGGLSVGLVCKSLLGKAHTVMAEGGVAAALGYVEPKDNWKVHFRDTMKGGRYLNQWRMAQLHAIEAPDRVKELEEWGALFDRTADGRILQRNFGGHKYPRLAHVGDRTGLEMIRTLQQHGIHCGMKVYMECTISRLLTDGHRARGAFGYWRDSGASSCFAPNPSFSRRAASAAAFGSIPTPGNARATGRRWPTSRAPSSWTWSSCSFTRRGWCGRRAFAARSSPRASVARAGRSATRTASGSCSGTSRALRERDGEHGRRGRPVAS